MDTEIDEREFVIATYAHRAGAGTDIDGYAQNLAALQSSGAWVELASQTDTICARHAARVRRTWEIAEDVNQRVWAIEIAYPTHNVGRQIPLLLATVYGECASWSDLKLIDLRLPESFVRAFNGPRIGLAGIRELVAAPDRPLLVAIMKPSIGLSPSESAAMFYQAAIGGADAVKDDEKLVSQPWSDFRDRVREHGRAAAAALAETGHRTLYFVNITDRPDRLLDNARAAVEAGASALLVNHLTVGISALSMLADDSSVGVPILGHLAFAGALYGSPWSGVGPHLVLGLLPRLAGADVVVYPSHAGTLPFTLDEARRVSEALTAPLHELPASLPMAGGGLHAGHVPQLVDDLGVDWALAAGGAIHGHPMGTAAGAQAIRQAIDATINHVPLDEARASHPELDAALSKWPVPHR